jgi:hypothetical protein
MKYEAGMAIALRFKVEGILTSFVKYNDYENTACSGQEPDEFR